MACFKNVRIFAMKYTVCMFILILLLIFYCVLNVVMPRQQTLALDRIIGMLSAGQSSQTSLGRLTLILFQLVVGLYTYIV